MSIGEVKAYVDLNLRIQNLDFPNRTVIHLVNKIDGEFFHDDDDLEKCWSVGIIGGRGLAAEFERGRRRAN